MRKRFSGHEMLWASPSMTGLHLPGFAIAAGVPGR